GDGQAATARLGVAVGPERLEEAVLGHEAAVHEEEPDHARGHGPLPRAGLDRHAVPGQAEPSQDAVFERWCDRVGHVNEIKAARPLELRYPALENRWCSPPEC